MFTTYKIRIYPTLKQQEHLAKEFGCARWVWNNSLSKTQELYKETGKGLSAFSMVTRIPLLKKEFEWLSDVNSQSLQSSCMNLSKAFVNFFEKRANYPKFKKKESRQTVHYPQNVIASGNKLKFPKLGLVKGVFDRPIVDTIKTVTVIKEPSGKYFAAILLENDKRIPEVSFDGKAIGLDLGISHIVVTSDGSKFVNPRHIKKHQKNLKRKQHSLARKKKGSQSRQKAKILVAKIHEKISNTRKDNLHKISTRIVNENQVICVEDLHVKGMMKNHNLAQSIGDAGWGMFTQLLKYKAESLGKGYIEINRFFPSSKLCSVCLNRQEKMPLQIRSWTCSQCNTHHDRDINAAENIRQEGLRLIAAGIAVTANGGTVSRKRGRKSSVSARASEVRTFKQKIPISVSHV